MGTPVTVDSDDVQTLLFATGVVKAVEAAVKQASQEEQFRSVKPKITEAHDRVANAWRDATRRQASPERYEPPNELQKAMLIGLARRGAASTCGMELEIDEPPRHRTLVASGLVDIGIHQERVVWNVGSGETTFIESKKQRLRLTPRAIEALGGVLDLTDPLSLTDPLEIPPIPPRDRACDRRPWWRRLLDAVFFEEPQ